MTDKHVNIETPNKENDEEKRQKFPKKQTYSLKGTFISVLLLGAFIVLSWTAIYVIFITR